MKKRICAAFVLLTFLLTGCANIIDNTTLIRPPRATGDKAGIQDKIELQAGGKYTFKYPQSGEYRSAITMKDIDSDGNDEAIAIFKPTAEQSGINIMILKENGNEWDILGSFVNNNAEVNRIQFADINGDGNTEILVGMNNYAKASNQLIIYYLKDGSAEQLVMNQTYSEIYVNDFTGNGLDEVLLLSLPDSESKGVAQLIAADENGKDYVVVNTPMNPEVLQYAKITYGLITAASDDKEAVNGLFVDGVKANGCLATEIVYWNKADSTLRSSYNPEDSTASAERNTQTVSKDINSDGIFEIPLVKPMPKELLEPSDNICNEIEWMAYDAYSGKFIKVLDTVVNYSDGYYFVVPASWQGNVTARYDAGEKKVSFYEWKRNRIGEPLLVLQTFSDKEWEQLGDTAGYLRISSAKNTVYAVKSVESKSPLLLEDGEVQQNFEIINNN